MRQQGSAAVPRVYLISTDVPAEAVDALFATLPPERAASAQRLRRAEARVQCVLGFCLVRYALYAETGRVFRDDWQRSDNGKPYLEGAPHFNLSHSAHAVAVAVFANEVGIDIETIGKHHPRLAKRICSDAELLHLQSVADPDGELTRIWSAKEAAGKRLGTGLEHPKSISTEDVSGTYLTVGGIPHVLSLSPAAKTSPVWVTPAQLLIER